jgi:hypothetical protein
MKLTPNMLHGLRTMHSAFERRGQPVMAEPNETTGKALLSRGLIAISDERFANNMNLYVITEAGKKVLDQYKNHADPA